MFLKMILKMTQLKIVTYFGTRPLCVKPTAEQRGGAAGRRGDLVHLQRGADQLC
jgi:hypothetical protein